MVDAGLKLKEREAKMTTSTTAVNQMSLMAAIRPQMKGRTPTNDSGNRGKQRGNGQHAILAQTMGGNR